MIDKGPNPGELRIGLVESIDTDKFRCELSFPGSYSASKSVALNPSPLLGFMPAAGSLVAVYDRPGYGKKILFPLHEVDGTTIDEQVIKEDVRGLTPKMNEGEIYIGRSGRAYFDNRGNVLVYSKQRRAGLELKAEKSKAELFGYNFDIYTPGKGVRIRSHSFIPSTGPVPPTPGDSLSLEVGVPVQPSIDSIPEVLPTALGRIELGVNGSISINSLPSPIASLSGIANIDLSPLGSVSIGHGPVGGPRTSGFSVGQVGVEDVSLFTTTNSLSLSSSAQKITLENLSALTDLTMDSAGNVHLGSESTYFKRDVAMSKITMTSVLGEIDVFDSGQISLSGPLASFGIDASGDMALTGKNVNITATDSGSFTAAAGLDMIAPTINLGSVTVDNVAIANALVLVFQQLYLLNQTIKTHKHIITGSVVSGAGAGGVVVGSAQISTELAAATVPLAPTASQIGSTTVRVQA